MKLQHLKVKRLTKKARKLLNGANYMVKISMKCAKIGEYRGLNPEYVNAAKPHEPVRFVKVRGGIPFVRPELHGF